MKAPQSATHAYTVVLLYILTPRTIVFHVPTRDWNPNKNTGYRISEYRKKHIVIQKTWYLGFTTASVFCNYITHPQRTYCNYNLENGGLRDKMQDYKHTVP